MSTTLPEKYANRQRAADRRWAEYLPACTHLARQTADPAEELHRLKLTFDRRLRVLFGEDVRMWEIRKHRLDDPEVAEATFSKMLADRAAYSLYRNTRQRRDKKFERRYNEDRKKKELRIP